MIWEMNRPFDALLFLSSSNEDAFSNCYHETSHRLSQEWFEWNSWHPWGRICHWQVQPVSHSSITLVLIQFKLHFCKFHLQFELCRNVISAWILCPAFLREKSVYLTLFWQYNLTRQKWKNKLKFILLIAKDTYHQMHYTYPRSLVDRLTTIHHLPHHHQVPTF